MFVTFRWISFFHLPVDCSKERSRRYGGGSTSTSMVVPEVVVYIQHVGQ